MSSIRNVLSLIGFIAICLVIYLYVQGWFVVRSFDPKAPQVISDFARRAFESDFASATVIKMPLAEGVSLEDAVTAMESRAQARNVALGTRLAFHEQIRRRSGREDFPHLEIFQFCDPDTAAELLAYNRDFVVFMPCRVALFEDDGGQAWVATLNLDLLIHAGKELDPELKAKVLAVKEALLDIMVAGASGSL